jgi:hypothetical protein
VKLKGIINFIKGPVKKIKKIKIMITKSENIIPST